MWELFREIFADNSLPHGYCILWQPGLLWLHVVSDGLITLAYYSIPLALAYFVGARKDLAYNWMFLLFSAFIFACGTTHLMSILTLWEPVYWLDGGVKAATAGVSVLTAILLWPLIPKAMALPSPTELELANRELQKQIIERRQIEAELIEMQRRLMESREAERLHLAQELHDGPLQELYGISYHLNGLKDGLSNQAHLTQLSLTQELLQQVIHVLRATAGELRPPTLAPFGLEKAIRSHVDQFRQAQPDLETKLELMPDGQALPERVRLALFRIYQQALNNLVRHARARQVWIRLKLDEAQVVLEVEDDGCGFEVPKRWIELARQGHLGLVGMAERTEAIGGQLQVLSTLSQGTLIRVIVPRAETG